MNILSPAGIYDLLLYIPTMKGLIPVEESWFASHGIVTRLYRVP